MSDDQDISGDEKQVEDLQNQNLTMMITHSQSNDAGSSPSAHAQTSSSTLLQQQFSGNDLTTANSNIVVGNRIETFRTGVAVNREDRNNKNEFKIIYSLIA